MTPIIFQIYHTYSCLLAHQWQAIPSCSLAHQVTNITYLAARWHSGDRWSSTTISSNFSMSSRSGTNWMALLQQWSPPERIIRMYPMAFPGMTNNTSMLIGLYKHAKLHDNTFEIRLSCQKYAVLLTSMIQNHKIMCFLFVCTVQWCLMAPLNANTSYWARCPWRKIN